MTKPDMMAILEDRGYRSTIPRQQIVGLLKTKEEGFTAEEICEELAQVGRATVFRTVKILLEAGLVCKLSMPNGVPRYSLALVEHHHHTVCVNCSTVGEFRASTVERLMRSLGNEIDGEVIGHRIEFYITCNTCLFELRNVN